MNQDKLEPQLTPNFKPSLGAGSGLFASRREANGQCQSSCAGPLSPKPPPLYRYRLAGFEHTVDENCKPA